ncbi:MAG: glycosyltransferase family 39 protein [bacterium]|nr:glycosyltransferase family 39 protein [bacterium]
MAIRAVLDFVILCSRHPLGTGAVLLALWLILRRRSDGNAADHAAAWSRIRPALAGLAVIVCLAFLTTSLWYLNHDGYASDVEAMVSSVSWWVQTGGPLYHAPDADPQYSVLYGPVVYLATGLCLDLLHPSIFAAKLGALLALYASVVLLYLTIRRLVSGALAFGMIAIALLLYWTGGTSAMLVRPDPYILFAVCLGLHAAGASRRVPAVVGAALALGLAVNLKVHAVLYLLPVLTLLDERHGSRATRAALALGAVAVVAPFALHDGISLVNYLSWILIGAHHGLELDYLPHLFTRALFFAIPVLVLLSAPGRPAHRPWMRRQLVLAWAAGNAAVIVLAMKPGAGQVHLLPMIPINLVFAARLWPAAGMRGLLFPERAASWRLGAVSAFLAAALVAGSVSGYRSARLASSRMENSTAISADIRGILAAHPDRAIGMGYSGDGNYFHLANLRPLLTFSGNPLLIDAVSLMDSRRAHREIPEATLAALDAGVIDLWLVPRGRQPFRLANWYPPHDDVFSDEVRARFSSHYRLEGHSRYFDLWGWDQSAALDGVLAQADAGSAVAALSERATGTGLHD